MKGSMLLSKTPFLTVHPNVRKAVIRASFPRQARNSKFGFGGAGKRSKQNTKESTDSFEPRKGGGKPIRGGKSKGRGGAQRPGKSRRMAARGRN